MPSRKADSPARHSRALAYHTTEYLLRTLRNLGPMFGFDYELMVIALSVAVGNVQHLVNAPEQLEPYADLTTIIPADLQRPMTRLAITRSTGLPRETVRRKVAALIEAGVLIKDDRGGVRLTPGSLTNDPFLGAVERNDADVRRLMGLIRPLIGE